MNKSLTQKRRITERRKHPRIITPSGALFSFKRLIEPVESEEHTEGEGTITDLSREGCRLLSDIPLVIGEPYHLILQVSKKSRPIIIEAAVCDGYRKIPTGSSLPPYNQSMNRTFENCFSNYAVLRYKTPRAFLVKPEDLSRRHKRRGPDTVADRRL